MPFVVVSPDDYITEQQPKILNHLEFYKFWHKLRPRILELEVGELYFRVFVFVGALWFGAFFVAESQEARGYWQATNTDEYYDNAESACRASWESFGVNAGLTMGEVKPIGAGPYYKGYSCSAPIPEGGGYWGTAGSTFLRCPAIMGKDITLDGCSQINDHVQPNSCDIPEQDNSSTDTPVHLVSGSKFERITDFSSADGLLHHTRTYLSSGVGGTLMGAGWTVSNHTLLRLFDEHAVIETGDGVVILMTPDESEALWSPTTAYDHRLHRENDGGWRLVYPNGRQDWFDDEARILRTTHLGGYQVFHDWNGELMTKVTDSFGRAIEYEYDEHENITAVISPTGDRYEYEYKHLYDDLSVGGRVYHFPNSVLTKVTYPDDGVIRYEHGTLLNRHKITGIFDQRNVKVKTIEYAADRALESKGADGRMRVQTPFVNTNRHLDRDDRHYVINPLGHSTEWKFEKINGYRRPSRLLSAETDSTAEAVTKIGYTNAKKTSLEDAEGNTTRWERDELSRPTKITFLHGTSQEYTVDVSWHESYYQPISIEDNEQKIVFDLDDFGNVLLETRTDKVTGAIRGTRYTYEIGGLLSSIDGPLLGTGDVYEYTYTADGYLSSITDPNGNTVQYSQHDELGNPGTIIQPNGSVLTLTYDLRSRLISVVENGQRTTTFERDAAGNVTKVTLPTGGAITNAYDGNNWITSATSSVGDVMTFTYDNMGNITSKTLTGNRPGASASYEYDVLGRLIKTISADAGVTQYTYDRLDRIVGMKDPTGNEWLYSLDGLSRLLKVTDPEGDETSSEYAPDGDETTFSDGRDLTTSYTYNGFGEIVTEVSPDRGTTHYSYDEAGRLAQKTDAKGNTTQFSYDVGGRLLSRSHSGNIEKTYSYAYDENGDRGLLTSAGDPSGSVSFDYNIFEELISYSRTIDTRNYALEFSYTDLGKPFIVTYPSGREVRYAYDALGRVKNIKTRSAGQSWENVVTGVGYAPMGPIIGYNSFNGLRNVRALDSSYRLQAMRVQDDTRKLLHKTIKRDAAGRIVRINDQLNDENSARYAYTPDGRLRLAVGPWGDRRWWYDGVGNRKRQRTVDDTGTQIERTVYPATSNQIRVMRDESGAELRRFGHDANGNMLWDQRSDGRQRYIYDADNRLHRVKKGDAVLATYAYDGFNRRISRRLADGTRVHFIFGADGRPLAEHNGQTGDVIREFVWLGDMLVATIEDGQMYAVHGGHLGQPLMATDAAQSIVWQAELTPFGAALPIVDGDDPGLRFPGQWVEAETGLLQNWHRDYDPSLGRYIEADPLGLDAGQSLYGYVGQDPLGAIDPEGLRCYGMGCYEPYKSVKDNTDDGKLDDAALMIMGGATAVPILGPMAAPMSIGGGGSSTAGGFLFGYGVSMFGEMWNGTMDFGQVVKDACFSATLGKIGGQSKSMADKAIPSSAANAGAGRMALGGTGAAIGGGMAGAAYGAGVDQDSDAVGDRILEGLGSGAVPRP